jgi:SAM-dependent methyltransferase
LTDDRASWTEYQPGLVGSTAPRADEDVARRRYELEPHILDVVPFASMTGSVVELGCGIGTDGLLITRTAQTYIGLDFSCLALEAARTSHAGLGSAFARVDLRSVPLRDGSADFVYSHGVLHHLRGNEAAWAELHRVLRPGGRFCVMVYHRHSVNYYYGILFLRRLLLLLASALPRLGARFSQNRGEGDATLAHHLAMFRAGRRRYLFGPEWLSRNTDGPQNTFSRVYSKAELRDTISAAGLVTDELQVRYVNARVNPPVGWLPARARAWLGRIAGWHLYAIGHKE